MKDENMTFGQFIRSKRLQSRRELTLREMGEQLGISLTMYSEIEQGRKNPGEFFDYEKVEPLPPPADSLLFYGLDLPNSLYACQLSHMSALAINLCGLSASDLSSLQIVPLDPYTFRELGAVYKKGRKHDRYITDFMSALRKIINEDTGWKVI